MVSAKRELTVSLVLISISLLISQTAYLDRSKKKKKGSSFVPRTPHILTIMLSIVVYLAIAVIRLSNYLWCVLSVNIICFGVFLEWIDMIFFLVFARNLHVSAARTKSHAAEGLGFFERCVFFCLLHREVCNPPDLSHL